MPAESKAQRIATAIAEHHPEDLYERNKGLANMTHKQLHDFASTSEKGLPQHVHKNASYAMAHKARKESEK